jgi:hypothetical protein
MGTWAQTASVFLIPAILLLTLESAHVKPGAGQIVLAWCSGLLATLLFAQDFYTAQFALIVAIVGVAPSVAIAARSGPVERLTSARNEPLSRGAKAGILMMVLGAGWMSWVWIYGGATVRILGLRVASHDWLRPALVMAAGLALFLYTGGGARARTTLTRATPWSVAFTVGAVVGTIIFLLIYVPAYREHPAFPAHHLLNSLILRDPSHWHTPDDIVRDLAGYSSERPFYLIFILAVLGCVPTFKADRRTRLACLWFLCFSVLVLLIPFRFGEFSVWKTVFQPLPGCFAIRDPKRIIYVYELAVVLAAGLFIARLPPAAKRRAATAAILIVLLAAEPNWIHFEFRRPNETYARWVERPIDIDPSCRSFFIEAASPGYTARPNGGVTMYQIDSMFVALNHSIPTLNGYSAFLPPGWPLNDPRDPGYAEVAASWAGHHNLQGVCAFDIEQRTMTPAW